jgi:hypothetical protein
MDEGALLPLRHRLRVEVVSSGDEHLICADQRILIHDQAENGGFGPWSCENAVAEALTP